MMAFFCPKTGIRLKEPGIAKSAGGDAEEYTEEAPQPKKSTKKASPQKATKSSEEKD